MRGADGGVWFDHAPDDGNRDTAIETQDGRVTEAALPKMPDETCLRRGSGGEQGSARDGRTAGPSAGRTQA